MPQGWHKALRATGAKTYEGSPCRRCGGTTRRAHNSDCVKCKRVGKNKGSVNLQAARFRAKRKGLDYSLQDDVLSRVTGAPCPACGSSMVPKGPNAPSLDRVLNDGGYTPANVAVICRRCNTRKGDMSAAELQRLADWARAAEAQVAFFDPVL